MKIQLIQIGKTHFEFIEDGVDMYTKRITHYCKFDSLVLEIPSRLKTTDTAHLKKYEAEQVLKRIKPTDYVILLDERGDSFTSVQFASLLQKLQLQQNNLVFVIGGAYGFDDSLYTRANKKLSLSKMTYSHQLIRLIFAEQLYRAFTIIKGEPYHHD